MRNSHHRHGSHTAPIELAVALCLCACGGAASAPQAASSTTPEAPASAPAATPPAPVRGAVEIPLELQRAPLPRSIVASGLNNPRGMHLMADGRLLVAEAGTGDPDNPLTGALLELRDGNGDGDYLDEGERRVLLGEQPSKNILGIVRRDEVFGMAGMAEGGGQLLVSLAFFGGPSHIFAIEGESATPWGETHLNINDLTYVTPQGVWVGAASTTDEVVKLLPGGGAERIVKLPPLPSGQDAVPGYLRHDPISGRVLVTLFSGSPEGEEGGEGTELVPRSGAIVAVDPVSRDFSWAVTGLTVPTDLEVAPDGSIYVLEFCDAFLDPVGTREAMAAGPSHGGFKRFSGRLLRIDRGAGAVTIVADGLDAPSNLTLGPDALYVAEGMGTPGRLIPAPDGTRPLTGYIERIELPAGAQP